MGPWPGLLREVMERCLQAVAGTTMMSLAPDLHDECHLNLRPMSPDYHLGRSLGGTQIPDLHTVGIHVG